VRIVILERRRHPVDVRRALELDVLAPAHEVLVFEADVDGVRAAAAAEADSALERPDVTGLHFHVDHAVGIPHGTDVGIVQIARLTQHALGLGEPLGIVQVSRTEQQLVADRRLARTAVHLVDELVHRVILALGLGIKDVAHVDDDLAHVRPVGHERRVVGDGRFRSCAVGRGGRDSVLRLQRPAHGQPGDDEDDDGSDPILAQRDCTHAHRHLYCSAMNDE
jgi:hypothetical protein